MKGASSTDRSYLHGLIRIERLHRHREDSIVGLGWTTDIELWLATAEILLCVVQILNAADFVQELDQTALRVIMLFEHGKAFLKSVVVSRWVSSGC